LSWTDLTSWWLDEIATDPAYEEVVTPLLLDVLEPQAGKLYLDLGCGEGRVMRAVAEAGAVVHGIDLSYDLAARARNALVARLPPIPIRDDAYDGLFSVLVLEHIEDHARFFAEAARVSRRGGVLAVVVNHPVWTAPGSTPITDVDGEVLWRPGSYFSSGLSEEPAGETTVMFHHRSLSELLNSAARVGWSLQRMIEMPHHDLEVQSGIPRLLACRWALIR
jgi:SAM-dependent methyltransferase